ncbi:HYR domain-containing protein [Flavobacterium sp. 103]|uniref:HYR domain-containing protein n=1 Tax=Flavobacterium sp. 103 TaxID=2135624 RepID=UPI000D5F3AB4|nr:HYR domain-containing protein [Flavobacterium sp. 103]PVX47419.1 HYR domain-containing protein [Flavobacterium sp. 103]
MKRDRLSLKNNFALLLAVVLVFLIQQTAMGQIQGLTSTTPVCLGESSTITVSSDGFLANVSYTVTYSLSGVNTATDITIGMSGTSAGTRTFIVPTNSLTSSGTTTVTITRINAGDITANNTVNITVLSPFTAGAIANTGETICSGNIPTLTIGSTTDASGGDNSIIYQWQYSTDSSFLTDVTTISDSNYDPNSPPPPGRSGSVNGATYLPTQTLAQTTYYRRQAKDGSCNTTFTSSSEVWTVTVNLAPDLLNFSTDASDACAGLLSQITISSTTLADGNYNVTYVLSGANSGTETKSVAFSGVSGTFNTVPLNVFGNTTITITNIESGGCSTVPTTGQSDIFVVNEVVTASVSISTDSDIVCSSPSTKTFTATTINGGPFTLYEWKVNGAIIANSISNVFTYSVSVGDKVVCDATSIKPCAIPKPATSNEITMVVDTIVPIISCPAAVTVSADAGFCTASNVSLGNALTTDNCGVDTLTNDAPVNFPIGTTTVTWTVTDVNNNQASCTQSVTVTDTEKPVITCPTDVSVVADAGLCTASAVALGTATATDNCSTGAALVITNDAPPTFNIGTTTVTWTATDAAGNTTTCQQSVTVTDTEKPTITCPINVNVVADAGLCTASAVALSTATATDNCSTGVDLVITNDAPTIFSIGTTIVTWTATDAAGNTATCQQSVTVTDTEKPTITCPSNVSVLADAGLCTATGVALGTATATDNCSSGAALVITNDAPTTFNIGTTTVTWTATDAAGNTQSCTQTVTVTDTEKPTITCPSNVSVVADAGVCTATGVALGTPTVTDNCSTGATLVITNDAPTIFSIGTTIVTWAATDAAGNTATCQQTVTVTDTEKPVITCPTDVSVVADAGLCTASAVALGTATATDNCSTGAALVITNDAPPTFNIGTTTVTWTATDAAGNTTTCQQSVTVTDTEKPTITCPSNVSVAADAGLCTATGVALGTPTAADNCSTGVDLVITNDAPTTFNIGTTTVTWTATDAAGNTQTCTQTVTVTDTEKPTITCPSNVSVVADAGVCTATGVALGTPTVTDNCSTGVDLVITNDAPTIFSIGTTIVTWTATDAAGNTATCQQSVTVTDTEKPTITCPSNVSVLADAGLCTATGVALGTATATDNCSSGAALVITNDAPATFNIGATTVTWTATDAAGNTQSCTQTVTVTDTEKPTITCPSNVSVVADAGVCTATGVALGTPTAADNCSTGVDLIITNDAVEPFNIGTTTVTWTATDAAGNTQTCTQTVTVSDTEKPTITCPANVSVAADAGVCTATGVALGTPIAADNCSTGVDLVITNDAPTTFNIGTTTVTWTATDAAGNTQTCTQTVTVTDTEKPTITCPSNVSVVADAGLCTASGVDLSTPTAADNCSTGVDLVITYDAPTIFNIGTTTVTWTATDAAGNTATCQQSVTVSDTEKPVITCPTDVSVVADAGLCTANGVALGTPTVTDNCSTGADLVITNDAPITFPLGATTITWTATDTAGNTQTCTQTVTVSDNQKPTITCPANVSVAADAGLCTATGVALGTPIAGDNCSIGAALVITNDAPATFNIGTTTVTWTATDAAGNTQTCTQTVTVSDTEKPTITCPANVSVAADAGVCTATGVALGTPIAADNCSTGVDLVITNDAPTTFNIGTTTVTWTATDAAGNTQTCTQTVTVTDTEKPTITCPSNVSVVADAGVCTATGVALGTPTVTDNCSSGAALVITNDAPTIFSIGTTTVTWTATDAAGNTATCQQTVTVTDTEKPVITCPTDVSVVADAGLCTASAVALSTATATDNCSTGATLVISNDAPPTFNIGTTTVTWTATDAAGNTQSCTQTVTVSDTEKPTITCPTDVSVVADAGLCTASAVVLGTAMATDNCSTGAALVITNDAPPTFNIGTTTVTWTATDAAGNTQTCTQTVTVSDTEKPTIICPANVNVVADAGLCTASAVALGTPTATDNCSTGTNLVITNDAPTIFSIGTTIVTWTATDAAGNTATCQQSVTVTDTEKPTITCPSNVSVVADAGLCTSSGVALGTATATDNCSTGAAFVITNDAPPTFNIGTTTVTWTATDAAGNTTTCQQSVTVTDTEKPTITCPINVNVVADAGLCTSSGVALGTPIVTDNCSTGATLVISNDAPTIFNIGITTVTWTATDAAGNTQNCTQTVTVSDTEKPTITCPINVNVVADAGLCTASAVALGTATATDNCSTGAALVITNDAPPTFNIGTTTVTWTATDAAGNTQSCTQSVTVTDTEKPTITCPTDVSVVADAGLCTASAVVLGTATATDNCSTGVDLVITNDAPTIFSIGTTIVTWTATDAAGNTATCQQSVTVTDTEKPTITCPSNVSVLADAGLCTATGVALGTATATDNCSSGAALVITNDAPATFNIGTTIVTWTATDAAGNTATCQQSVTVTDTEKPTITCPSNVSVVADAGLCTASGVDLGTPTAADNCSTGVDLVITYDAPTIFNIGTTTVTWTATDAAGNTATCQQSVTVSDTEKPVITCPTDVSVVADAGLCTANGVALGTPTVTDNCSTGADLVITNDAPITFPLGATTITWTATDTAGNTQTCTQTVTVSDNQKPTITCPANVSVAADAGLCTATGVALGTPIAGDNCSIGAALVITNDAPATFNIGTTTVTWTATDAAGNTQTCTQTVTVSDTEKPIITCPANVSVAADAGVCTATGVALGTPIAADNCSTGVDLVIINDAVEPFNIGTTTVTWTATDAAGNTQTCTQTVTVTDTEKPTITCPSNVSVVADAGVCTATGVALGTPIAADNCSTGVDLVITNDAPTTFNIGTTTVTWTATDISGNTATCEQTVTVSDTEKPTITCPSNVSVVADAGLCTATGVNLGTATATDNCSTGVDLVITNDAVEPFNIGTTTVTWTATDAAGNTQTCTQIVSVLGIVDAVNDTAGPINGLNGGDAGINILDNDILNCTAVIPSQVKIVSVATTELKINNDGTVTVTPGTAAGIYTINYQICEILNPSNCDTAKVTVTVTGATDTIDAVIDILAPINGTSGGTTQSVFANDTLNGQLFSPADVILTSLPLASGLSLNPDGTISVAPLTAPGVYPLTYTICQVANPIICDTATTNVIVTSIDAVAYVREPEIGTTGGTVLSVFDNDTLNGLPFLPADVILTSLPLASGLTLNPDGTITVAPGTAAGRYPLTYTICQVANPTICDTTTTSILVTAGTPSPSVSITKDGTYVDNNGDGRTNVGDSVFYNFVVTNTGNVPLFEIIVTDINAIVTGGPIDILGVGSSNVSTFTAIHNITQADIDAGQVDNLALVKGKPIVSSQITATSIDPTPCVTCTPIDPNCSSCTIVLLSNSPSISLINKAEFNDSNRDGIAQVGETIIYKYTVINTGNVTLSNITISDLLPGVIITGGPIALAPEQSDSVTFVGTYTLVLQDLLNGSVTNQSIVSAIDTEGNSISDLSDNDDGFGDDPTVIEINGCEIKVYNALSPNDSSGINDALIISGIECYPNNSIEIYNRWGALVFEAKGYDNVTNVFKGVSEGKGTIGKDSNLPDGTYFYLLKYSNSTGDSFHKTGYLYIEN